MAGYAIHRNEKAVEEALKLARGSYQRDIINGYEALSGATLKGAAKLRWGMSYKQSRENLLARLRQSGIPVEVETGPHNKRILVIG